MRTDLFSAEVGLTSRRVGLGVAHVVRSTCVKVTLT